MNNEIDMLKTEITQQSMNRTNGDALKIELSSAHTVTLYSICDLAKAFNIIATKYVNTDAIIFASSYNEYIDNTNQIIKILDKNNVMHEYKRVNITESEYIFIKKVLIDLYKTI